MQSGLGLSYRFLARSRGSAFSGSLEGPWSGVHRADHDDVGKRLLSAWSGALVGRVRLTEPQGVFLSALLTFASAPWYSGYAETTAPWGLGQLTDQQLAGAIMWLPGGVIYLGTALVLLVTWIRVAVPRTPNP
jgi:hypothetical protein